MAEATSRHAHRHGYRHREDRELRPWNLFSSPLCGCTASDVVGILHKKREPFTGLEVHARTVSGHRNIPQVYTEIKVKYRVRGKVSHKAWKMLFAFRKKNIARFQRCSRSPQRSLPKSNSGRRYSRKESL